MTRKENNKLNYPDFRVNIFGRSIHPVQIFGIVLTIIVWELLAQVAKRDGGIPESAFPSFAELPNSFIGFGDFYAGWFGPIESPELQAVATIGYHMAWTISRFGIGLILGLLLGYILGLALSWNSKIRNTVGPLVTVFRTVPLLALIPLFLLWFGSSQTGKIIYVTYAVTVLFAINTLEAVDNLSATYKEFASTLGASKLRTYKSVIMPGIFPELVGGIRVLLGIGWGIVLASEFIASQNGLGKLLIRAQSQYQMGRIMIILFIFMILSLTVVGTFLAFARRMTAWTE
jgi:ABC-type nitrate/sulfonate/bicarbonate transport system permease component